MESQEPPLFEARSLFPWGQLTLPPYLSNMKLSEFRYGNGNFGGENLSCLCGESKDDSSVRHSIFSSLCCFFCPQPVGVNRK